MNCEISVDNVARIQICFSPVARLIEKAYQPDAVPAAFAAEMSKLLSVAAQGMAQTTPAPGTYSDSIVATLTY